jgi:hypothetical protein
MDMQNFDWKKLVQGIAPLLGTALLGPLAGTAIAQLGAAILGRSDATEAEIAAALTNGSLTGEQIVAMKTADQTFETRMRELDIDVLKINQAADDAILRDLQDARARQVATKDYMPQTIFFLFLAIYIAEVAMFFFGQMPTDEYVRALMTRAFGTVEAGVVGAVAYFIGSSRGSKNSGDAIRKIAEQASK